MHPMLDAVFPGAVSRSRLACTLRRNGPAGDGSARRNAARVAACRMELTQQILRVPVIEGNALVLALM
jgi:hypothetical protein